MNQNQKVFLRRQSVAWGFFLALVAVTAGRLFWALQNGLSAREAYYWLMAARWEWANFEGPGGLTALVAGLRGLFGPHPELLRVLSPLAVGLASLGLWRTVRAWAGSAWALGVVAAWNILPGLQIASVTFGPEPVLWACWSGFLAMTSRAILAQKQQFFWWLSAGGLAAMGVLVSYAFLLAPLGLGLFWLSQRPLWRRLGRWLRRTLGQWPGWKGLGSSRSCHAGEARRLAEPSEEPTNPVLAPRLVLGGGWWWVGLLPGLALTGPVLWHVNTDGIALAGFTWRSLIHFGGFEAVLSALANLANAGGWFLCGGLLWAFAVLGMAAIRNDVARWWFFLALPPAAWMLFALWRGQCASSPFYLWVLVVLPGWVAWCQFSTGRMVTNRRLISRRNTRTLGGYGRSFRGWARPSLIAAVLLVLTAGLSMRAILQLPHKKEPRWDLLAERVQKVAHMFQPAGEPPLFFIAGEADIAAALGFFFLQEKHTARDFPPVYLQESQNVANQFGLWPRYDAFLDAPLAVVEDGEIFTEQKGRNPHIGRSAIFIGTDLPADLPQVVTNSFAHIVPLERVRDPGGRFFYLYLCRDYQTAPL